MELTKVIISASVWAFFFAVFRTIFFIISAVLFRVLYKPIFDMKLDIEQRKFDNLEKLSKEIDDIEKSVDERSDNLKLMIAEIRLERCRRAYRTNKKVL